MEPEQKSQPSENEPGGNDLIPEVAAVRGALGRGLDKAKSVDKRIVLGALAFALAVLAILAFLMRGGMKREEPRPQPVVNEIPGRTVSDPELGIEFKAPERWGEPSTATEYLFAQSYKLITFSREPRVKIYAAMQHPSIEGWLGDQGLSTGGNPKQFCDSYSNYRHTAEDESYGNGNNTFRLSGIYVRSLCDREPPYANVAVKTAEGAGEEWRPFGDAGTTKTGTRLFRSYFFALGNPVYATLTMRSDVATLQGSDYCTQRRALTSDGSEFKFFKNFRCMNYEEKEQIDRAFRSFDASPFAEEVKVPAATMKAAKAGSAADYEERFKRLASFADAQSGIEFDYPAVIAAPALDKQTGEIRFPSDPDGSVVIRTSTKESMPRVVVGKKQQCGGGCLSPWLDVTEFEAERALIEDSQEGPVSCPRSQTALAGQYGRECAVERLNGTKALVRYYAGFTTGGFVEKNYVFYTVDGRRFDAFVRSATARTTDLREYKRAEAADLTLKVAEAVARSVRITK